MPEDDEVTVRFQATREQGRIWRAELLSGERYLNHVGMLIEFDGSLNVGALSHALNRIVDTHPLLRSTFAATHDGLCCSIKPRTADVLAISQSALPDLKALQVFCQRQIGEPFALQSGPLYRATLAKVGDHHHGLVFVVHHIVFDAFSCAIFFRELRETYAAILAGQRLNVDPRPADASGIIKLLTARDIGRESANEAYWKRKLEGAPVRTTLPGDRSRPRVLSQRTDTISLLVPPHAYSALTLMASQRRLTKFSALLGACFIALSWYCDGDDFVIGSSLANRGHPDLRKQIGFFVRTLVIRHHVPHDQTVNKFLESVQQTLFEAIDHSDIPYDRLVEVAGARLDPSQHALFQTAVVWEEAYEIDFQLPAIEMHGREISSDRLPYDLFIRAKETSGGLSLTAQFSIDLFDRLTIKEFLDSVVNICRKMPGTLHDPICQICLSEQQDYHARNEPNVTRVPWVGGETISGRFMQIASLVPDATAILHGADSISYRALSAKVDACARHLRDIGIGAGAAVGIALPRGVEAVAAILGIMKAGAAWVFVNPSHGPERISHIISDSGALAILTDDENERRIPADAFVINVGTIIGFCADTIHSQELDDLAVPEAPAYVLNTSGTTGRPKGVVIAHDGIVGLADWQARYFQVGEGIRISQLSSFEFDASIGELVMALLNRGTLCIIDHDELAADRLVAALNRHSINVMVSVPSILRHLDPEAIERPDRLTVVCVGETCPMELARHWSTKCRFVNGYGPTEFSVYSHVYDVAASAIAHMSSVPIGKPIDNARAVLVDRHGRLVPRGGIGEIYLSGRGLAVGYCGGVRADRFPNDGFCSRPVAASFSDAACQEAAAALSEFRARHFSGDKTASAVAAVSTLDDVSITCLQLAPELREDATRLIAAVETDASSIEALVRYSIEGFLGTYRSCGLTAQLLREILALRRLAGSIGADFGCGNGDCLDTLRDLGVSAIGVDFSPSFVRNIRGRGLDARLSRIDCLPAQFAAESGIASNSLDFALATLVLDRVARPKRLLNNMLSSLRHDGTIAIQTPLPVKATGEGPYEHTSYTSHEHRVGAADDAGAARAELVQLLTERGVVDIVMRPLETAVVSLDGCRNYQLWSIAGRKRPTAERLQRQYRTGDLGRLRADGNIEFLGRIDRQIKIRGQRVEIAGIEEILRQHPKVVDAAVAVAETPGSGQTIVAYVIPVAFDDLELGAFSAELAAHARQRLSSFEVPSRFLAVRTLPLNSSGKIAYDRLPGPEFGAGRASDPPRAGVECAIAEVWRDVLQLENCGREDNIFDLGADSILIVQIVSRLAARGLICTVNDLFVHQTVADLAAAIGPQHSGRFVSGAEPTRSGPPSPVQRWFLAGDPNGTRVDAFAILVSVNGPLNAKGLRDAVEDVVARHDILRSSCRLRENIWELEVDTSDAPAAFVDTLDDSHSARGGLSRRTMTAWIERAKTRLAVLEGPRLAVAIAPFDGKRTELIVLVHHFVADIVSLGILIEDLAAAYDGRLRGDRGGGAQVASFLGWTKDVLTHAASADFATDAASWAEIDARCRKLAPQHLVAGRPSRNNVTRVLTGELPDAFREATRAGRRDAALELIAAAFASAYSAWSEADTVAVFLESHGRDEVPGGKPLGRAIGWFSSFYPLVIDGEFGGPAEMWLARTQSALAALPAWRQGYLAWRQTSDSRALHEAPPPQSIVLNYLGDFDHISSFQAPWRLLDVRRVDDAKPPPQAFDLELNVWSNSAALHFSLTWEAASLDEVSASSLVADTSQALAVLVGVRCEGALVRPIGSSEVAAERTLRASATLPLSELQQGMLFHSLVQPHSGVYVNQVSMTASSVFDPQSFATAFSDVGVAHEALRCYFAWEGLPQPVQIVKNTIEVPLLVEDWSELSPEMLDDRRQEFAAGDICKGFDFGEAPLMRLHAARLPDACWHVTWTFHHVLIDGWSVGIVLKDVLQAYVTRLAGKPAELASSPPLSDVVAAVGKPERLAALAFWRERLGDIRAPTPLLERAIAPRSGERSGYVEFIEHLDQSTADALADWARRRRLTVNTVAEGLFAVLLSRYADCTKVVFGVTVSVRVPGVRDIDRMVGLLINTIPRAYAVPEQGSLTSFLASVQAEVRACEPWAATPLAVAHEASGIAKDCALFESILIFENYALPEGLHDRFAKRGLEQASFVQQSNYPLNMVCVPRGGLSLQLSFDRSRVADGFAKQFLRHFARLLAAVAEREDWPIDDLPTVRAFDPEAALLRGDSRVWPITTDMTLDRMFDVQVARVPDRIAVIDRRGATTYAQLARLASHVSAFLQSQGIAPEERVGICVERSVLMYAGLLGILMAGAAYVPLDPRHPRDVILRRAEDAGARLILTDEAHVAEFTGAPSVVLLERITQDERSEVAQRRTAGADSLAYTMFTSGSTGAPKQVLGTHRATLNCMFWRWEAYPFARGEIACQKTALVFGDSVQEIFGPLLAGVTTVVIPDDLARDPEALVELLSDHAVSRIVLVPSLLREILRLPDLAGRLAKLKLWIASGETLPPDLVAPFYRHLPSALLVNLYGASEISCDVTWAELPVHKHVDGPVSIGLPIANTAVAILDSRMRLLPAYVPGVLYVGGQGLSRGYLDRPDLTAAAFVPDPFCVCAAAGERLYQTGDIVIYDPSAGLRFLGRQDQQIKLRGQRIDLEEIAETLRRHDEIESAVVMTKERAPGDITLVAFIVPAKHQRSRSNSIDPRASGVANFFQQDVTPGSEDAAPAPPGLNAAAASAGAPTGPCGFGAPCEEALRAFLAERLPSVIIPAHFITLKELPCTASGKVDRQRLAALSHEATRSSAPSLRPKSAMEERVAAIWSHILGRQIVDRNANFFDAGGHSLLLIQVRDRVIAELDIGVSLEELYRHTTVADLARHLSGGTTPNSSEVHRSRQRRRIARDRSSAAGGGGRDSERRSN
jgi:amino acid adenylation domain-containing protein